MSKIFSIVIIPVIVLALSYLLGQYVYEIPAGLATALTAVFAYFTYFNWILPVDTITSVIGYIIILYTISYSFQGGLWLWRLVASRF